LLKDGLGDGMSMVYDHYGTCVDDYYDNPKDIYYTNESEVEDDWFRFNLCIRLEEVVCPYIITVSTYVQDHIERLNTPETIEFYIGLVKNILRQSICNDSHIITVCAGAFYYLINLLFPTQINNLTKSVIEKQLRVRQGNMTNAYNSIRLSSGMLEYKYQFSRPLPRGTVPARS
jgi:hypothetical protein